MVERYRNSLFLLPMAAVLLAVGLAAVTIVIDSRLGPQAADLPIGLTSTVESARAILSTIAAATITFAAIAFSISLLIIQQASSQYSPRVVHTLFRDPFNTRVMGLVVGTFTYCLIVLRSVRSALDKSGDPVIPNLSVAIAVVLGVTTILAIVAFINHSAHSMDISKILDNVQQEAIEHIRHEWTLTDRAGPTTAPSRPPDGAYRVRFDRSGWIQQIDLEALHRCIPDGATMWVEAYPGRYAVEGTPVCAVSTTPDDTESMSRATRATLSIGDTRSMQQDVSFGLRQLADIAVKALSPGINDPTTAQDAIFHTTAVLAEILRRDSPATPDGDHDDRHLILTQVPTHGDLIRLAFDETRRAAVAHPTVAIYLLHALGLLQESLESAGLTERCHPLVEQAALILAGSERADLLPADLQQVESIYAARFPSR